MWSLDAHLVATGLVPLSMVSKLTKSASEIRIVLYAHLVARVLVPSYTRVEVGMYATKTPCWTQSSAASID